MTTLYIKTHNITGLKYFGKTTREVGSKEFNNYIGSGLHWSRHLKVHGNDVTTEIYAQFDEVTQRDELVECALRFSEENNIVESKEWANMKPENGLDGGFFIDTSGDKNPRFGKGHLISGDKNPRALIIHIYNSSDELMYVSNGNLRELCKQHNLPFKAIGKSYNRNEKMYQRKSHKGWEKYIGWYAIKIK